MECHALLSVVQMCFHSAQVRWAGMLNLPRAAGVPRSVSSTFCLVEAVTATAERLALEVAKSTAGAQLSCQCARGEERHLAGGMLR